MFCAPFCLFGQDEIRTEINKLLKWHGGWDKEVVPGFVISLIEMDTVYHFGFGNLEEAHEVKDLIFEMGSFSKLFTSLYLEKLISKNQLKNESLINLGLGIPDQDPISIYRLKNHLTNFPKKPDFIGRFEKDAHQPYEYYSKDLLIEFANQYASMDSTFKYSHINTALLEIFLENKMDRPFSNIMDDYFQEMRMSSSSFDDSSTGKLVQGHDKSGSPTHPFRFASFLASEGLRSCHKDMSQFIQFSMFSNEFEENLEDHFEINFQKEIFFKYPWFRIKNEEGDYIYMLAGRTAGHNCQLFCLPKTKTAVLLSANGSKGVNHLALNTLAMMNDYWSRKP